MRIAASWLRSAEYKCVARDVRRHHPEQARLRSSLAFARCWVNATQSPRPTPSLPPWLGARQGMAWKRSVLVNDFGDGHP
jgi:hypothetical protein